MLPTIDFEGGLPTLAEITYKFEKRNEHKKKYEKVSVTLTGFGTY